MMLRDVVGMRFLLSVFKYVKVLDVIVEISDEILIFGRRLHLRKERCTDA